MTEPTSTEPQRVGDVPAARLLRVIADRIDQGWPAPDQIDLYNTDEIELAFHCEFGRDPLRATRWVGLFSARPSDPFILSNSRAVLHRGNHLDQRVRITVFTRPEGGEPR